MVNIWSKIVFAIISQCQDRLVKPIIGYFPAAEGSLLISMIFGGQLELSADISHDLKVTGMQHVTSASGANIGVILQPLNKFCRHFRLFSGWWSGGLLVIVWIYVFMASAKIPLLRAALMASQSLLCKVLHRQYRADLALFFSAMGIWLIFPNLLANLSFQLSYSASLGIIWILPLLSHNQTNFFANLETQSLVNNVIRHFHIWSLIKEAFLCTLAVQLVITPILWLHGFPISLLSLPVNAILVWLVPLITLGGLGFIVISFLTLHFSLFGFAQTLALILVGILLKLFILVLAFFGQCKYGLWFLPNSLVLAIGWWGGLLIWRFNHLRRKNHLKEFYKLCQK